MQLSFRTKNGLVTPVISTWTCLLCTFDNKQAKTACEICRNERSPTKRAIGNEALGYSTGSNKASSSRNSEHETIQRTLLADSNESSNYSTPDNKVQLLLGFRQGNDISDLSECASSSAVSGAGVMKGSRYL